MAQGILVVTEIWNNSFRKISFEALSEGKRLAEKLGEPLTALVLGENVNELAQQLSVYGPDTILVGDDAAIKSFRPCEYVNVVKDAIEAVGSKIVLFGATRQGKELSARIAAKLRAGLAVECSAFDIEDQRLVATRSLYGGKVIATVDIEGEPQMASIRPNVFEIEEKSGDAKMDSLTVNPGDVNVTLVEEKVEFSSKADLTETDYIVSGGRGMGGPDYSVLEALAARLNGAVGASRNAVDLGWRPQSDQVGQTGRMVSPKLYIACGISGAMQHVAGMSTSDVIVAINNDPDALIFRVADYKVIDDLFEVVPEITKALDKK